MRTTTAGDATVDAGGEAGGTTGAATEEVTAVNGDASGGLLGGAAGAGSAGISERNITDSLGAVLGAPTTDLADVAAGASLPFAPSGTTTGAGDGSSRAGERGGGGLKICGSGGGGCRFCEGGGLGAVDDDGSPL